MKNSLKTIFTHLATIVFIIFSGFATHFILDDYLGVSGLFWASIFLNMVAVLMFPFGIGLMKSGSGVKYIGSTLFQMIVMLGFLISILCLFLFWGTILYYMFQGHVPFRNILIVFDSFILPLLFLEIYLLGL